jgi:uncharacterized membrane protein YbjE (DUF340 family)
MLGGISGMLEYALSMLIVPITILIACIYIKHFIEKTIENSKKELKNEVEMWLNSEKGQKALYAIGALVGSGMKAQFSFLTKGGKFKWQDLVAQIGIGWAQKSGLIPTAQGTTETAPTQRTTDNLNIP